MGVELSLTSKTLDHTTDLCTDGGYEAMCGWLESLPHDRYPSAQVLADTGEFTPTDQLARELNGAFYETPPDDPDTRHVVDRFLDLLGVGGSDETVAISA